MNLKMSPVESQFIRLYVKTIRRRYSAVKTTIDLMHPNCLGVTNFADAARMAAHLDGLYEDFDTAIEAYAEHADLRLIPAPPSPSFDELADLFTLSFFKIMRVAESSAAGLPVKQDTGWHSGKPTEWKKVLNEQQNFFSDPAQKIPAALAKLFDVLPKFFAFLSGSNAANSWPPLSLGSKKLWPPDLDENENDYEIDGLSEDEDFDSFDPFAPDDDFD